MNTSTQGRGEIILYQTADGNTAINVKLENETVWLTQAQMAVIFDCSTDNIGQHLKNIYKEQELAESSTTEIFSVVRTEGARKITRKITHYNLDAILSVGYRVSSNPLQMSLQSKNLIANSSATMQNMFNMGLPLKGRKYRP